MGQKDVLTAKPSDKKCEMCTPSTPHFDSYGIARLHYWGKVLKRTYAYRRPSEDGDHK